jgi:beta-lactamase class A
VVLADTELTERQRHTVSSALDRFVGSDAGRSIAVAATGEVELSDGRGEEARRPAASLMKLPIVMSVLRAGSRGVLRLEDSLSFDELPASELPALTDVLERSHVITIRELCGLALVTSDNSLAQYLLERVSARRVDGLLDELGCHSTSLRVGFSDGDLRGRSRDNLSTVSDMIRLLDHVLETDEMRLAAFAIERTSKQSRIPLLVRSDGGVRTGHKTGTLASVCNDVGFIADDRVVLRLAVLCDGQTDVARCGLEIGECAASIWQTLGGGGA